MMYQDVTLPLAGYTGIHSRWRKVSKDPNCDSLFSEPVACPALVGLCEFW